MHACICHGYQYSYLLLLFLWACACSLYEPSKNVIYNRKKTSEEAMKHKNLAFSCNNLQSPGFIRPPISHSPPPLLPVLSMHSQKEAELLGYQPHALLHIIGDLYMLSSGVLYLNCKMFAWQVPLMKIPACMYGEHVNMQNYSLTTYECS